jgi:hypothetical protein
MKMRISILVLALSALCYAGCNKTNPTPAVITPMPTDPAQESETPDNNSYPLIGDYEWRVVTHKMVRAGSTTLNNWDLTMKFSANKVRYTYNGGANSDYPAYYNFDTIKVTYKLDSTTTYLKSLHLVEGKYEWHLEGLNCHCVSSAENFDVFHLRR